MTSSSATLIPEQEALNEILAQAIKHFCVCPAGNEFKCETCAHWLAQILVATTEAELAEEHASLNLPKASPSD
jgi:hypothetical protein